MLANPFALPVYAGPGAMSGTAYPLTIDNALAALAFIAGQFQPTASGADLKVAVAAGMIPSAVGITTVAAQEVVLAAGDPVHPRIDRVVIDRFTGAASVVQGVPGADPVAPDIPAGKMPVCRIIVQAGAAAVVNTDGTDERCLWGLGASGQQGVAGWYYDDATDALHFVQHSGGDQVSLPGNLEEWTFLSPTATCAIDASGAVILTI